MNENIRTLVSLLTKKDFKGLLQHYMLSSEDDNISQLAFVYQQGQKSSAVFEFYQQIATKFIESKGLPELLINQINQSDALSFFTPALKLDDNFTKTNQQQRNCLHYLLAGNHQQKEAKNQVPFNYLRSMMLFESNEKLSNALLQRDCKNLTPVEVYLQVNGDLTSLPAHEFTALLALIEIETMQQAIMPVNYTGVIKAVKKHCNSQKVPITNELQRIMLIATYYQKPAAQVMKDIITGISSRT